VIFSQKSAVALEPLPEPLHPLRVARREVAHGVDDGAGQPSGIDRPGTEASRGREVIPQPTPVELFDRANELGCLDGFEVDDLGFHRPLDRSRQGVDRLARVLPMGVEVRRHWDRLSERDEHPPQERRARLEREPHRDERQLARTRRLVAQREAGRTALDALDGGLGMRRAFWVDRDEAAAVERLEAGGKCLRIRVHLGRVVLLAAHGDRPARTQETGGQPMTKHRRGGEEVDLSPERRRNDEGVDQVVRVVDAEEHWTVGRDVLRVPDVDGLEAEPEPEPNDEPYGGIETVRGLGCRARLSRRGEVRATSPSR